MQNHLPALKKCRLFIDLSDFEILTLLKCLNAQITVYRKDSFIFQAGDKPEHVGIVLEGCVHIVQEDYWGNRIILNAAEEGHLFGEAFSCALAENFPVSAVASEKTTVMLIDYRKIITTCSATCSFHAGLIQNMLRILADKNILLTRKIEHISKKKIWEKVLSYLSEQALQAGSNSFAIPFNRQELADYLAVERSALSKTLCKMRDDEMLTFHKNKFVLKE